MSLLMIYPPLRLKKKSTLKPTDVRNIGWIHTCKKTPRIYHFVHLWLSEENYNIKKRQMSRRETKCSLRETMKRHVQKNKFNPFDLLTKKWVIYES
jgi:hypothetical protein